MGNLRDHPAHSFIVLDSYSLVHFFESQRFQGCLLFLRIPDGALIQRYCQGRFFLLSHRSHAPNRVLLRQQICRDVRLVPLVI